ncbi:unnamed protein product, partial [Amoebophrya sp. A120]
CIRRAQSGPRRSSSQRAGRKLRRPGCVSWPRGALVWPLGARACLGIEAARHFVFFASAWPSVVLVAVARVSLRPIASRLRWYAQGHRREHLGRLPHQRRRHLAAARHVGASRDQMRRSPFPLGTILGDMTREACRRVGIEREPPRGGASQNYACGAIARAPESTRTHTGPGESLGVELRRESGAGCWDVLSEWPR